jgi:hypothetical protein
MGKQEYRDTKGRFEPGNPGGPGRTKAEIQAAAFRRVANKLDGETWDKMVEAMIVRAECGDVAAFNTLRDMYHGKPVERIALDDGDDDKPIFLTLPGRGMSADESDEPPALDESPNNGEE